MRVSNLPAAPGRQSRSVPLKDQSIVVYATHFLDCVYTSRLEFGGIRQDVFVSIKARNADIA